MPYLDAFGLIKQSTLSQLNVPYIFTSLVYIKHALSVCENELNSLQECPGRLAESTDTVSKPIHYHGKARLWSKLKLVHQTTWG